MTEEQPEQMDQEAEETQRVELAAGVVDQNESLDEKAAVDDGTPTTTRNEEDQSFDESTMERVQRTCCPYGLPSQVIPLALCFAALVLTFAGSWDCSYFQGANISFTGNHYGLWMLEDYSGKCQLWDVIFFAYDLGGPLRTARAFSMISMTLGLGLLTTMMQALQFNAMSWSLGVGIVILLIISITTSNISNLWIVFWLFSYIIYILLVRALFIHPVHRRISSRGNRIIASLHITCALCCILTTVVFASDFCTCENLTDESLAGRDPGDPCDSHCAMRTAGVLVMVASALWVLTAVATLKLGIQPEEMLPSESEHLYAHYPRSSITTRVRNRVTNTAGEVLNVAGEVSGHLKKASSIKTTKRTENETSDMEMDHMRTVDAEEGELSTGGEDEEDARAENESDGNNNEDATEDDDEGKDSRSCCQKFCFDYRVVPRSRREKWSYWTFRSLLVILFILYVFIVLLLIGSRAESTRAAKAPDTTPYFTTDEVCAFDPEDPYKSFESFPTKEEANAAGYLVAHCGNCGLCSNPADIEAYVDTRETVAKKSKECGPKVLLGSYNDLVGCLQGKIGFSRDCTTCWADNMKSTTKYCIFTCMTTLIQGFMGNNNVPGAGDDGWLNKCLFCDERMSGPEFVTCSGVARRRLGIESEIERNPDQLCTNNDVDWLDVFWEEVFPRQ